MSGRIARGVVLAIAMLSLAGAAASAQKRDSKISNPVHEKLLKLAPPERAAVLAQAVGNWCIGTETFAMGVLRAGPGEGNAYWSLRCADGTAWAVQIDPLAEISAIDCDTYKEQGAGNECFKKF